MREIGMAAAEPRDREFEKLVARYWRDIVHRAIWLGVAERDAEDIAQDVFVVALEKCATRKGRAWINEVCRRRTANYRKRFRHTYEEIDHEAVSLAVDEPDDAEVRAAVVDGVRRALEAMGEGVSPLIHPRPNLDRPVDARRLAAPTEPSLTDALTASSCPPHSALLRLPWLRGACSFRLRC